MKNKKQNLFPITMAACFGTLLLSIGLIGFITPQKSLLYGSILQREAEKAGIPVSGSGDISEESYRDIAAVRDQMADLDLKSLIDQGFISEDESSQLVQSMMDLANDLKKHQDLQNKATIVTAKVSGFGIALGLLILLSSLVSFLKLKKRP